MLEKGPKTEIIALKQEVNALKVPSKGRFLLWALPISILLHGFIWASAEGLKGKDQPKDQPIQMVFHVKKTPPAPPVVPEEPKVVEKKPVKKVKTVPQVKPTPPPVAPQPTPEPQIVQAEPPAAAPVKPQRKIRARVKKGLKIPSSDRVKRHAKLKRRPAKRKSRRMGKGRVHRKPPPRVGRADKGKEPQDRVWQCGHEGREQLISIHRERSMSEWIKVVPTVLAPFSAQTDLMAYLEGVNQIQHRRRNNVKRLAPFEMALPNEVLVLDIEAPVRMQAALGFLDARCMVGFSYTRKKLFPFTLHSVPIRFTDENGNVLRLVADAIFYRDAHIELVHKSGDPLLFDEIKLKNSDAISTNIEAHYAVAGVVKEVASFFGIDLWKKKKKKNKASKKKRDSSKKNRAHLTANAKR